MSPVVVLLSVLFFLSVLGHFVLAVVFGIAAAVKRSFHVIPVRLLFGVLVVLSLVFAWPGIGFLVVMGSNSDGFHGSDVASQVFVVLLGLVWPVWWAYMFCLSSGWHLIRSSLDNAQKTRRKVIVAVTAIPNLALIPMVVFFQSILRGIGDKVLWIGTSWVLAMLGGALACVILCFQAAGSTQRLALSHASSELGARFAKLRVMRVIVPILFAASLVVAVFLEMSLGYACAMQKSNQNGCFTLYVWGVLLPVSICSLIFHSMLVFSTVWPGCPQNKMVDEEVDLFLERDFNEPTVKDFLDE